jgi:diketogulonate reductase-like aldo/keto reductase
MPANGLGLCCRAEATDDQSVTRAVLWYLLLGGRLLDTAELYLNHKAIGKGIDLAVARGVPKDEIWVTSTPSQAPLSPHSLVVADSE